MAVKSKKTEEPAAPSVPAYIVTFSDMVTLLLTFFVMLLSLAQVQDPELFHKSRDAFNEHINNFGLGMLMGKQMVPDFKRAKMKYYISDPDSESASRTIDSKEETLRRLFQKAAESMQVLPSRVKFRLSDFSPAGIHFAPGETLLDEDAQKHLSGLAEELRRSADSDKAEMYILGLDRDGQTEKERLIVSSLRAQQAADYMDKLGFKCPIYAWGGGDGQVWAGKDSPISEESQLLIAFIRQRD